MPTVRQRITALITRRYPFLSGCGTFANSKLVQVVAGRTHEQVWARLSSGAELLVPMNDYVGRSAYYVGDLDRKISQVIRTIVRPGDHVLDIGANMGLITLQLATLVGESGRVDSFEPNPAMNTLLSRSIEHNKLKNVHIHTCALGAQDGGILDLNFPEGNAGQGTLTQTRPGEGWKSVQVPVRTLSSLATEHKFSRVRLVKIDVEGYEPEVLRGAVEWLSTTPPDAIVFESNEGLAQGERDPVLDLLAEQGYALYSIPKRLFSLKLMPHRPDNGRKVTSHDMLAVAKHREQEIAAKFTIQD